MPKPTDPKKWSHMFSDDVKFVQKIAIFNPVDEKLFLTVKRSSEAKTHPNFWDLPGGNVLYGQDASESLRSEILEETGLESFAEPIPVLVDTAYNEEKKLYRIFIGFKTKIIDLQDIFISHEHQNYKWVTIEEFLNLQTVDVLKKLVKRL